MNEIPEDEENERRHPRCGARNRQGEPCRNAPSMGRSRCRFHGGHTPVGAAHPRFRTGRYSRYLPRRLAERFQELLRDPHLLSLNREIALVDARLEQLLARTQTTESAASWEMLHNAKESLVAARARGDVEGVKTALSLILEVVDRGQDDASAWDQIRAAIHDRRLLVASESKRLLDGRHSVSLDNVAALMTVIGNAIKLAVPDVAVRRTLIRELSQLTAHSGFGHPAPDVTDDDEDDAPNDTQADAI
jgi:hypothetical protein